MKGTDVKRDACSLHKVLTFASNLFGYVWVSEFVNLIQEIEQTAEADLDKLGAAIGSGELFQKIKELIQSYLK